MIEPLLILLITHLDIFRIYRSFFRHSSDAILLSLKMKSFLINLNLFGQRRL